MALMPMPLMFCCGLLCLPCPINPVSRASPALAILTAASLYIPLAPGAVLVQWTTHVLTCTCSAPEPGTNGQQLSVFVSVTSSRTIVHAALVKAEEPLGQLLKGCLALCMMWSKPLPMPNTASSCDCCCLPWIALLLCDGCHRGYHGRSLTPALTRVPDGQWFCPHCVQSAPPPAQHIPRRHRREVPWPSG
jgi:hypothetical protein